MTSARNGSPARALVLGGGAVGIGWQTGLLTGLREAGVDLAAAGAVAGTSAGARRNPGRLELLRGRHQRGHPPGKTALRSATPGLRPGRPSGSVAGDRGRECRGGEEADELPRSQIEAGASCATGAASRIVAA
jgi:hypothetical protein